MNDGANGTDAKGETNPENHELASWNGNAFDKFAKIRGAAAEADDDPNTDRKTNSDHSSVAAAIYEEVEFDPYNVDTPKNATSFWGTVVHMVIVGVSPTLLNLPHSFDQVGSVVGFFGALLTVALYVHCMHMVVASEYALCKRLRKPNLSYTEVVYYSFSKGPRRTRWLAAHARLLVYVDFVLIWAGGNAIYVIMICENFKSTWEHFVGQTIQTRPLMIWLTVPLVLLCWIPNLNLLVACSLFTNVLNMSSIVVILWYVFHDLPAFGASKTYGDPASIPYFLGTIFITVNGTGLILSLKNQMKHPEKFKAKFGVMNLSYVPIGALYALFGTLCYVRYGAHTKENVILNLPQNAFCKIVIGLYGLGVVFFYPLVSYVTFDIVWNEMLKQRLRDARYRKLHEYAVRTANALSSVLLAYAVPEISLFMSLAGTVGTSLDSIILPAVVEILVFAHERRFAFLAKNVAIVALGAMLMVAGFLDSYRAIVKFYSRRD